MVVWGNCCSRRASMKRWGRDFLKSWWLYWLSVQACIYMWSSRIGQHVQKLQVRLQAWVQERNLYIHRDTDVSKTNPPPSYLINPIPQYPADPSWHIVQFHTTVCEEFKNQLSELQYIGKNKHQPTTNLEPAKSLIPNTLQKFQLLGHWLPFRNDQWDILGSQDPHITTQGTGKAQRGDDWRETTLQFLQEAPFTDIFFTTFNHSTTIIALPIILPPTIHLPPFKPPKTQYPTNLMYQEE